MIDERIREMGAEIERLRAALAWIAGAAGAESMDPEELGVTLRLVRDKAHETIDGERDGGAR